MLHVGNMVAECQLAVESDSEIFDSSRYHSNGELFIVRRRSLLVLLLKSIAIFFKCLLGVTTF